MDLRLPFNTLAFRTCTHSEIIPRLAYNLNSSHTFIPSESFMPYHKISGSSWICTQSQIISRFSHNLRSLLFCLVLFLGHTLQAVYLSNFVSQGKRVHTYLCFDQDLRTWWCHSSLICIWHDISWMSESDYMTYGSFSMGWGRKRQQ